MTVTPLTADEVQEVAGMVGDITASLHPSELPELIKARIRAHKKPGMCAYVYGRLSELGDMAGMDPRAIYRIAAAVADDIPLDVLRAERVAR